MTLHELSDAAVALLQRLYDGAIPERDIEPDHFNAVWIPRYARTCLVRSPKPEHFGALDSHLQITDKGRKFLTDHGKLPR